QDTAEWLLKQLPPESEVAVIDSRSAGGGFAVDRAAAAKAIERLHPSATPRPLPEVIATAIQVLKQKPQVRKEIYCLSDCTTPAWRSAGVDLKKALTENPTVLFYVID